MTARHWIPYLVAAGLNGENVAPEEATKLADAIDELQEERDACRKVFAEQCDNEDEARKIATSVVGELAANGDGHGVPTIADVVESMKAKYERAIACLRKVEESTRDDAGERHWSECALCGYFGHYSHAHDCELAAILAEHEEEK